jgi:hypothetical protein
MEGELNASQYEVKQWKNFTAYLIEKYALPYRNLTQDELTKILSKQ